MPRKILDICDDGMVLVEKPEHCDCEDCPYAKCMHDKWSPDDWYCTKDQPYFDGYRYIDKDQDVEMGCPQFLKQGEIELLAMTKEEVEEFINDNV